MDILYFSACQHRYVIDFVKLNGHSLANGGFHLMREILQGRRRKVRVGYESNLKFVGNVLEELQLVNTRGAKQGEGSTSNISPFSGHNKVRLPASQDVKRRYLRSTLRDVAKRNANVPNTVTYKRSRHVAKV